MASSNNQNFVKVGVENCIMLRFNRNLNFADIHLVLDYGGSRKVVTQSITDRKDCEGTFNYTERFDLLEPNPGQMQVTVRNGQNNFLANGGVDLHQVLSSNQEKFTCEVRAPGGRYAGFVSLSFNCPDELLESSSLDSAMSSLAISPSAYSTSQHMQKTLFLGVDSCSIARFNCNLSFADIKLDIEYTGFRTEVTQGAGRDREDCVGIFNLTTTLPLLEPYPGQMQVTVQNGRNEYLANGGVNLEQALSLNQENYMCEVSTPDGRCVGFVVLSFKVCDGHQLEASLGSSEYSSWEISPMNSSPIAPPASAAAAEIMQLPTAQPSLDASVSSVTRQESAQSDTQHLQVSAAIQTSSSLNPKAPASQ